MNSPTIDGPSIRHMVIDGLLISTGTRWRRKKDGKVVEIVWMHEGWRDHFHGYVREPAVQVRASGATNLKNTHWINAENLPRLYEAVDG